MEILTIITITLNIVILLISLYLLFLFIKCKELHKYPNYNIMIISLIILIDNAFRLFPAKNYHEIIQYTQAFTLTFLDKLLLTTITSQVFILFLGMAKAQVYYKYERTIFYLSLFIPMIICIALTTLYILIGGKKNHEDINHYFYCGSNELKDFADPIFNSIFLFLNICYFIDLLAYVFKTMKQDTNDEFGYGKQFWKFIGMLIINSLIFAISYLIIFHIIPMEYIDIIYLIICLAIDVYYNINEANIEATKKIFCIKTNHLDKNSLIELNGDNITWSCRTTVK